VDETGKEEVFKKPGRKPAIAKATAKAGLAAQKKRGYKPGAV
jgi:hypothetical protein